MLHTTQIIFSLICYRWLYNPEYGDQSAQNHAFPLISPPTL